MPSINFPTSPALNDQYSFEGKTWTYNGTAWVLTSSPTTIRLDAAFSKANIANLTAQAAFDKANTGTISVSGIFDYGLVTEVTSYTAYDYGAL